MPFSIDAQANPLPALILAALVCVVLAVAIRRLRRREERGDRDSA